jgi:hypothetical protein
MMVSLVVLMACGDSGSTGGSGGSGGSSTGGSSSGGSSTGGSSNGGGPSSGGGGSAELTCETGCAILYDCGAENMNCMGFTGDPTEKATFVGDADGGCIQSCNEQAALLNLIQPDNCAATIMTIKGVSPDFADVCDNGFSTGGGGAGM